MSVWKHCVKRRHLLPKNLAHQLLTDCPRRLLGMSTRQSQLGPYWF